MRAGPRTLPVCPSSSASPHEQHASGRNRRREAQSEDVFSGFGAGEVPAAQLWVPVQRFRYHGPAGPGVGPAGTAAARRPPGFGPAGGGLRGRGARSRLRSERLLLPRRVSAARPRLPVQPGGAAAPRGAVLPARTPAAAAGACRQSLPAEPGGPEGRLLRYGSARVSTLVMTLFGL